MCSAAWSSREENQMKSKQRYTAVSSQWPLLFEPEVERFSGISRTSADLHSELAERHESSEKALLH